MFYVFATWQCRLKPGPHQQQCRSNVRLCCQKRQQCRTSFALKFRPFDKVERCFDIVAQNGNIVEATGNKVACCFDNVALTLLLVWTGLKALCFRTVRSPRSSVCSFVRTDLRSSIDQSINLFVNQRMRHVIVCTISMIQDRTPRKIKLFTYWCPPPKIKTN